MQKSRKVNFKKKPNNNLNYLLNFNYDNYGDDFERRAYSKPRQFHKTSKGLKNQAGANFSNFGFLPFQRMLAKYDLCLLATQKNFKINYNTIDILESIKWDDILVMKRQSKGKKCSICLDTFVLPRISKCGHVFSSVCLDRMLYHEEKKHTSGNVAKKIWVTCPLCNSMFLPEQCKRVHYTTESKQVKIGMKISLSLIERNENSHECCSLSKANSVQEEKKVELLTKMKVINLFRNDEAKLCSLLTMADSEETFHIRRVLERLKMETARVLDVAVDPVSQVVNSDISKKITFYQVMKGYKNVFLHPFNMKCLKHQEESLPLQLEDVKILEVSEYPSINNEFRKKFSHLNHILPASEVVFIEVNLEKYLSSETLEVFKDEIQRRQARRNKKNKSDRRVTRELDQKNRSIREDFQNQLKQLGSSTGLMNQSMLQSYAKSQEELQEFLRSSRSEESSSQQSENSFEDGVRSFANIVDKNGYFPTLNGNTVSSTQAGRWGAKSSTLSPTASFWPELKPNTDKVCVNLKGAKLPKTPKRRKASRKKRVEIFSTSGGRSYR